MTKQELLKIVTVPTQKETIVAKYFGIVCMCRSQLIITSRNHHFGYLVGMHKQVFICVPPSKCSGKCWRVRMLHRKSTNQRN